MTEPVPRAVVEEFYRAYVSRDPQRIGALVDDDVEWQVAGPAEVMQVCGHWRGKAAVIDRFARHVPQIVEFKSLDIECLLVDGDSSAMFGRIACTLRKSGRTVSHRVANYARFRDGKLVFFRMLNDGFDAVEQFIGHRIDLTDDIVEPRDDVFAI